MYRDHSGRACITPRALSDVASLIGMPPDREALAQVAKAADEIEAERSAKIEAEIEAETAVGPSAE